MKINGHLDLQSNELQNIAIDNRVGVTDINTISGVAGQLVFLVDIQKLFLCQQTSPTIWLNLSSEITFVHTQSTASTTWTISHGLNSLDAIVQVYDSTGAVIIPNEIKIVDANTITVSFTTAIAGKAVIAASNGTAVGGGGVSTLDALTDTTLTTPANGDMLLYNGTSWKNTAMSSVGNVAFKAYEATSTILTMNSTNQVLIYDSERFDTDNAYNTTTGRFQPSVAGYYQINASLGINSDTSQGISYLSLSIAKNSVETTIAHSYIMNVTNGSTNVSDVFYLNGTTDYIEIWYEGNATGTVSTIVNTPNYTQCTFSGHLVDGVAVLPAPVAFKAYQTTDTQALTMATWNTILFDSIQFDDTSAFDTATNRFQPTVAGYYTVSSKIYLSCSQVTWTDVGIFKNGVLEIVGSEQISNTFVDCTCSVSGIVYLNGSTDYIEASANAYGTSATILHGSNTTWFSAVLSR